MDVLEDLDTRVLTPLAASTQGIGERHDCIKALKEAKAMRAAKALKRRPSWRDAEKNKSRRRKNMKRLPLQNTL
jgi:hypothetical protein